MMQYGDEPKLSAAQHVSDDNGRPHNCENANFPFASFLLNFQQTISNSNTHHSFTIFNLIVDMFYYYPNATSCKYAHLISWTFQQASSSNNSNGITKLNFICRTYLLIYCQHDTSQPVGLAWHREPHRYLRSVALRAVAQSWCHF